MIRRVHKSGFMEYIGSSRQWRVLTLRVLCWQLISMLKEPNTGGGILVRCSRNRH
ncbi:hypothetical protein A2U01_0087003 [Trifolium medium]|uniref:Uncharacterized protein n=1 Tax=Trifolium medium TaxID=97028 RepID=A0A392U116_9FABA|nr:hypothetical protein [Trifolium medium]